MTPDVKVDQNVCFTSAPGDLVVAIVTHVWDRHDSVPPLINITERQTAEAYTSVPHVSDVAGATGYFYS